MSTHQLLGLTTIRAFRHTGAGTRLFFRVVITALDQYWHAHAKRHRIWRKNASGCDLRHEAGIDPKVSADIRGHGIDVAIDVYTKAPLTKRAEAAELLETAVLTS